jgi:hypothetical protein
MEGGAVEHNFERDTPRDHLCQVWTPYIDASFQVWLQFLFLIGYCLKKSSPLKLLGKMEPNLAGSIYVRCPNLA